MFICQIINKKEKSKNDKEIKNTWFETKRKENYIFAFFIINRIHMLEKISTIENKETLWDFFKKGKDK